MKYSYVKSVRTNPAAASVRVSRPSGSSFCKDMFMMIASRGVTETNRMAFVEAISKVHYICSLESMQDRAPAIRNRPRLPHKSLPAIRTVGMKLLFPSMDINQHGDSA